MTCRMTHYSDKEIIFSIFFDIYMYMPYVSVKKGEIYYLYLIEYLTKIIRNCK